MKPEYYMNYPTKKCPGDGYLWDNRTNEWFRPKTPEEYKEWFSESFMGIPYDPETDRISLSKEELDQILSEHKAPPKVGIWY